MIYIVEDDQSIRDIIFYTLKTCGFEAEGFEDGRQLQQALQHRLPTLILLDIMLPGISGSQILQDLRRDPRTSHIPVMMTTAKSQETDKIQALDQGADDYLVKPFGMMEMVARIRAVLRRSGGSVQPALKAHGIEINPESHTAALQGEPLDLTFKEFELLKILLSSPGKAFTRDELMQKVWETDFAGETRTVDVHIRSLRSKLKDAADCIRTVRGVGYRMEKES
ncbi:MAG: response regulator transcription factor [Erysipelotrichaceae bacterium]|nr:response regulator transcription factor [Erysipelotrichaceae bacterium]